jgi:hypothetical protein
MSTNNKRAVQAICKFIERHQDVEILGFVARNKSGCFLVCGEHVPRRIVIDWKILYSTYTLPEKLATKETYD